MHSCPMKQNPMHNHCLQPSAHPDYAECHFCGSLFRTDAFDHEAVYGGDYWNQPGRSTLAEQVFNVSGFTNAEDITKIHSVMQHVGSGDRAIEIGCAPGVLLEYLDLKFKSVYGIEYDERYKGSIENCSGNVAELIFGSFPECTYFFKENTFDCIIGLDILEHSDDGPAFMAEVHRLLKPGGTGIFMLPMLYDDGEPLPEGMYCAEHRAIYTQRFVKEWMGELFGSVAFDRWMPGHEIFIVRKWAGGGHVPEGSRPYHLVGEGHTDQFVVTK